MRVRWTQRRAWAVWILASLVAWVAIGALFTTLLKEDTTRTATPVEKFDPSTIAPAAGDPNSVNKQTAPQK